MWKTKSVNTHNSAFQGGARVVRVINEDGELRNSEFHRYIRGDMWDMCGK